MAYAFDTKDEAQEKKPTLADILMEELPGHKDDEFYARVKDRKPGNGQLKLAVSDTPQPEESLSEILARMPKDDDNSYTVIQDSRSPYQIFNEALVKSGLVYYYIQNGRAALKQRNEPAEIVESQALSEGAYKVEKNFENHHEAYKKAFEQATGTTLSAYEVAQAAAVLSLFRNDVYQAVADGETLNEEGRAALAVAYGKREEYYEGDIIPHRINFDAAVAQSSKAAPVETVETIEPDAVNDRLSEMERLEKQIETAANDLQQVAVEENRKVLENISPEQKDILAQYAKKVFNKIAKGETLADDDVFKVRIAAELARRIESGEANNTRYAYYKARDALNEEEGKQDQEIVLDSSFDTELERGLEEALNREDDHEQEAETAPVAAPVAVAAATAAAPTAEERVSWIKRAARGATSLTSGALNAVAAVAIVLAGLALANNVDRQDITTALDNTAEGINQTFNTVSGAAGAALDHMAAHIEIAEEKAEAGMVDLRGWVASLGDKEPAQPETAVETAAPVKDQARITVDETAPATGQFSGVTSDDVAAAIGLEEQAAAVTPATSADVREVAFEDRSKEMQITIIKGMIADQVPAAFVNQALLTALDGATGESALELSALAEAMGWTTPETQGVTQTASINGAVTLDNAAEKIRALYNQSGTALSPAMQAQLTKINTDGITGHSEMGAFDAGKILLKDFQTEASFTLTKGLWEAAADGEGRASRLARTGLNNLNP